MYFQISAKAPSHSTILLWVKKYGYYELVKPKTNAGDWIIILDESVQVGRNKLLVVYGIQESKLDFSRPLSFQDINTLALKSQATWTGEQIKQILYECKRNFEGKIIYAVADHGNSIKKALEMANIPHIYDITHCIALNLDHIYRNDPEFKSYTEKLTYLRRSQVLGRMSHLLPPIQRGKSRFMNLRPISDWGINALKVIDSQSDEFSEEKDHLAWVKEYRNLIVELALLNNMVNKIELIIKTNGLSDNTISKSMEILSSCNTERLLCFKEQMIEYFYKTRTLLPHLQKILCSSDILESSFGKYKNYLQANPMVGITNLALSIAAFTGSLQEDEIMRAFETTRVKDINQWTKLNVGKSLLAKRAEVFKMGCKYIKKAS